ncbi:hypothetical protein HPP92_014385 [Vanilla planifolia]|uniref:General transcription and DNA repair factor IIH subunit TFB5 n=1 Tax=Vanilla planifolia TaxID=51239 RepID=A0A835UT30_VANPL|nr:hypothetical protein HPP92_014385 [Vanilla planifolia]
MARAHQGDTIGHFKKGTASEHNFGGVVRDHKEGKMVNAIKGLFISCDIPMAQFIVNLNASLPASQRFIVHMLDNTHMFVQPHVADMIRSKISEFRDQNTYEKPA